LFGVPNSKEERMDYVVEIPYLGSLILTHTLDGVIQGMKEWPPSERPPMGIVFYAFRVMVGIGMLMLGLGLWSLWLRYRGKLYDTVWMHRAALWLGPSGFVAVLAGWVVTEVGRQPYTVYNLLRTTDSASSIHATAVAGSLIAFVLVYFALFGAGVVYILRLMRQAPETGHSELPLNEPVRAGGILPGSALMGAPSAQTLKDQP
jgi:cytochrome d ubiquinol oxidase subunit I